MTSSNVLTEGFNVLIPTDKEQSELLGHIIPKRRGPTPSVPGVSLAEGLLMGDEMLEHFGFDQYMGIVTAEMRSRPTPQIFKKEVTAALDAKFEDWYPNLLHEWIVPQMRAPYITYNKTSKSGYPGFFIPLDKLQYIMQFVPEVLAGDLARFEAGFITMNIRLQPEATTKVRGYVFIDDGGHVYSQDADFKFRQVKTPAGVRTAFRTRLVYNYPIPNNIKQVVDSSIIDLYNNHPAFHHNIFGGELLPVQGEQHLCLDVKHFERGTATCARIRAAMFGGVYGQIGSLFSRIPYCCPTDDWKGARFLYVNREGGWSDQYGSGDSAVAPIQKEIMHIVYASFFQEQLGYGSRLDALRQVAAGGEARLRIRNFGDDNSIDGDKGALADFVQYANQFLPVEEEVPPKFLGFTWYGKWLLGILSYLLKTYGNERRPGSNFRKFPFLGWVERRNIFKKLGHPDIVAVFEYEDKLLARMGLPWYKIVEYAERERQEAFAMRHNETNPFILQDKQYLLTAQELKALGGHQLVEPATTGAWIKQLVSKEIATKLQF